MARFRGKVFTRQILVGGSAVLIICVLVAYIRIPSSNTIYQYGSRVDDRKSGYGDDIKRRPSQSKPPEHKHVILFYGIKWWENSILKKYDPFENCSKRCITTTDIKQKADVVILQADVVTNRKLPVKRANQIWVFSEYESPCNMRDARRPLVDRDILNEARGKFNWTMGYRRDSDFVVSHGRFKVKEKTDDGYVRHLDDLMKTKHKTSTWFNSHCKTISKREQYGKLLQKHTLLDIFGTCGKVLKQCDPNVRHRESFGFSKDGHGTCMDFIDKEYKFFMSFENSLCWDYVTEKSLQRIMPHFIVPVVRTFANHTMFHPPGSIVDTSKFRTVENLGKYLNSIDDDSYRAFYSWRKHYYLENLNNMWLENTCRICERSYEPKKHRRVYNDIYKWIWTPNGENVCKPNDDLI